MCVGVKGEAWEALALAAVDATSGGVAVSGGKLGREGVHAAVNKVTNITITSETDKYR